MMTFTSCAGGCVNGGEGAWTSVCMWVCRRCVNVSCTNVNTRTWALGALPVPRREGVVSVLGSFHSLCPLGAASVRAYLESIRFRMCTKAVQKVRTGMTQPGHRARTKDTPTNQSTRSHSFHT